MQGWFTFEKSINIVHNLITLKKKKIVISLDTQKAFHKKPNTLKGIQIGKVEVQQSILTD